jgi:hypothetical protein
MPVRLAFVDIPVRIDPSGDEARGRSAIARGILEPTWSIKEPLSYSKTERLGLCYR